MRNQEGLLDDAPLPGMSSSSAAGSGRPAELVRLELGSQERVVPPTSVAGRVAGNTPVTAGRHYSRGSIPRLTSGGIHQRTASVCTEPQEQQCAEEECDPEECGDEKRPPVDSVDCIGNDKRPYLPLLLFGSTAVGALHMLMLEFPLVRDNFAWGFSARVFFLAVYAVTLGCMCYCVLGDPGKLSSEHLKAFLQIRGQEANTEDFVLPERCHKTWLFKQPIRRYDHYCRWLTNAIGLLNHREFVIMLFGLFSIGIGGAVVDISLLMFVRKQHFETGFLLLLHLTYSLILSVLAGPIFRLHVEFVSRNELANEWKQNLFHVLRNPTTGKVTPVNELGEEEFNEGLDHDRFEYDPLRNPMDKGWVDNCRNFWCVPRWAAFQLGEF